MLSGGSIEFLWLDGELLSLRDTSCAQIVLTCLESLFPRVEMAGSELGVIGILHKDIEALGLADEGTASG